MYHSLIQILSAKLIGRLKGATIKELEDHLGISRRSVYRVLEALDELGYPYYKDEDHENRFRLVESVDKMSWWLPLPSIEFDLEDRVLLDYLFEAASQNKALAEAVRKLREKITFVTAATGYALAPKESGAGESVGAATLLFSAPPGKTMSSDTGRHFSILLEAGRERRACEISYESRESGSVRTYPIHPLALFQNEDGIYCFVELPRYGVIRIIALERIRDLKILNLKFIPPNGFDATERLSDPFGFIQKDVFRVRLVFSKEQAPYVRERSWPEEYIFEDLPYGQLSMAFDTGGLFGLKKWILSWGPHVEVQEPEWLKADIKTDIEETLRQYLP